MAGLLGDFDLEGLLKDPLFRIGTNLMAAGGPQSKPHSFGQDLQTALNQYQQQTDADFQRQMQTQQMKAMEKKTAAQEKADAASDAIMKMIMSAGTPQEAMPQTATTPSGPVAPVTGNAGWRKAIPTEYEPYFQNAVKGLKHGDKITPDLLKSLVTTEAAKTKDGMVDPLSVGPPIPKYNNTTAKGLTQFTDPTWAGEFPGQPESDRFIPEKSIRAAGVYLDRLIDRTGSLENALRTYGGGMKVPATKEYADTILGRIQERAAAGVPMPSEGPAAPPAPPAPPPMPMGAPGAPAPLAPPMPAPDASGAQAQPGPQMAPPPVAAPAPMPATPTYQPPAAAAMAPAPVAPTSFQAPPSRPVNADFWGPNLARKSPMEKSFIAATLAQSSDPMKRQLGEGMQAVIAQELKQQAEDANAVPLAGAKAGAEEAAQYPFKRQLEFDKADKAIEVKQAEYNIEDYKKTKESWSAGRSQMEKLGFLETTLEGVETGAFTDVKNEFRKVLIAFGIQDERMLEQVTRSGSAKTVMNALILQGRSTADGAGMPGAMSDNDLKFLQGMVANMDQVPGSNRIIIDHLKRIARRQMALGDLAADYAADNKGGLGPKFDKIKRRFEIEQGKADLAGTKIEVQKVLGKWAPPPPDKLTANHKFITSPTGEKFLMEKNSKGQWLYYGTDVREVD